MEDNKTLLTIDGLVEELEFNPTTALDSMEALSIISRAKEALQQLEVDKKSQKQIDKTMRELEKAENLVKMNTTLVGGRIAYTALQEFAKKMKDDALKSK